MTARELILKYWRSWQTPSDFDEMEACLAEVMHVAGGKIRRITGVLVELASP
ncbi:MAG: hypothetical protein KTR31_18530 [Myxococcales bacterium]|nr:hypothetical protein [Myxococcales bacterium]